jgi:hypothetical protein
LGGRHRDQSLDGRHLARSPDAARKTGHDRVGLCVGGRPRRVGREALDERHLATPEPAVERIAKVSVARVPPDDLRQRDVLSRILRLAQCQDGLQLHIR